MQTQTAANIACCLCGTPVSADVAVDGRCLQCLASTVDIAEGIEKECEVEMCRTCAADGVHRWFRNPQWVVADMESAELLSLCVQKVKGMKQVRLVDAAWIWQEPHSRRLKIKLTVSKDVLSGRTLQQSFIVGFVVQTRNCDRCNRLAAKDTWQAKVQVRQRAEHPRTLLAMEQQMLKRQTELGRAPPVDVKRTKEGLDLTFLRRQHAQHFVTLLHALAPCRSKASQSAIANQETSRTGKQNVKHTWSVEVAPICRGDLVRLPPKSPAVGALGSSSRLALVSSVGGVIHLVDPTTGRRAEVPSEVYWRHPFTALLGRRQLSTFVILDIEADEAAAAHDAKAGGNKRGDASRGERSSCRSEQSSGLQHSLSTQNFLQADATVARERDFGVNDVTHYLRTHLGGQLEAGDEASGYDLESMLAIDEEHPSEDLPQPIVLVEKRKPKGKSSHAKRGSGAARRRKKREGGMGGGGDDGASSMCSGTTYQSDYSDLDGLDALAISLHEEMDDFEEDGLGPSLRGFLGEIVEGDEEGEEAGEEAGEAEGRDGGNTAGNHEEGRRAVALS